MNEFLKPVNITNKCLLATQRKKSLILSEWSLGHSYLFQGSNSLLSVPGILVLTLKGPSVPMYL